jgi:bifunctional non-homologous end joining protein LigD
LVAKRADETTFPEWVTPMAATLTQERFTGPDWVFERKFDGIRLLAFKNGSEVRLLSRNQLPQELPEVARAVAALPAQNIILDGEMTWHTADRRLYLFDIMWLDGEDLRSLPIERRREYLEKLPLKSPLVLVERLEGARPWEQACAEGWEGVIAKRLGSLYESRRSPAWLKMKCEVTETFVVGGFTDPQGTRVGLGALLVGHFQDNELLFAGKVGTGFDSKLLRDLRQRLDPLEIATSPFTSGKGLPRIRAHWVRPEIAVEVGFIEWTVHGKLRHPRLLRVIR